MSEEIKISKDTMEEFIELRDEGSYNMLDPVVRTILGITKQEHHYLISNFDKLVEEYGLED